MHYSKIYKSVLSCCKTNLSYAIIMLPELYMKAYTMSTAIMSKYFQELFLCMSLKHIAQQGNTKQ